MISHFKVDIKIEVRTSSLSPASWPMRMNAGRYVGNDLWSFCTLILMMEIYNSAETLFLFYWLLMQLFAWEDFSETKVYGLIEYTSMLPITFISSQWHPPTINVIYFIIDTFRSLMPSYACIARIHLPAIYSLSTYDCVKFNTIF
jgi:hypothetical protein